MNSTRAHPRYEIRVSAELNLGDGGSMTCVTRDLSLGGLGLDTERPLDEGALLGMELFVVVDDIEDETTVPLSLQGRVAWCRMRGSHAFLAGIQFVDLNEEQSTYLRQLVAATAPTGQSS